MPTHIFTIIIETSHAKLQFKVHVHTYVSTIQEHSLYMYIINYIDTIQVQLSHKPANLKAPEKLSFKDKLALHQRKVSKEGEDGGTRSKRQSWAPGHAPHSSSSSPAASPTHKLFSSSSVGTPPVLRG